MTPEKHLRIFLIGGSSGGQAAVLDTLTNLPKDINAAFLIVLHSAFDTPSTYPAYLGSKIDLEVKEVKDKMDILPGVVYVSKPNHHLFIKDKKIHLSNGPRENLFRPSIDVLFRSGAVSFANSAVGILLTGQLNDGVAGLEGIKKCGGIAIAQNPATSEFPDMPQAAIDNVEIDYVVNLEDMSSVIQKIIHEDLPKEVSIPSGLERENEIATKFKSQIATEDDLGVQVPISCSSCGGPLWEMKDSPVKRYRCHVGHAFTEDALLKAQNEALEEALWVSMRTLEEKKTLLQRMAIDFEKRGSLTLARSYFDKKDEVMSHLKQIRSVLKIND
ncbi:two-component system, chemotaxis family, response regulator CheB [Flavobacteriaceae bacterium MAR_2010_188]|nr:two-component system, chemotaxis family, response regulator CheB [Flavobacteriaceae bacterium MAR_2010_188]